MMSLPWITQKRSSREIPTITEEHRRTDFEFDDFRSKMKAYGYTESLMIGSKSHPKMVAYRCEPYLKGIVTTIVVYVSEHMVMWITPDDLEECWSKDYYTAFYTIMTYLTT